jgi:hypothetical protein
MDMRFWGHVFNSLRNKSLGPGLAVGGRMQLHGLGQKLFKMSKMTR